MSSGSAWGPVDGPAAEEQTGTVNNTPIGDEIPSTGVFTTLVANTSLRVAAFVDLPGYIKADSTGLFSTQAKIPVADIEGILPLANGGLGFNTVAVGSLVYASSANILAALAAGTEGQILTLTGGIPSWETVEGTGTVTSVQASGGTTGLNFTGGPITAAGTFTLSGTLNPANGGTGTGTAPTSGQILIGKADGTYAVAEITAGDNIEITTGDGTIEISSTGGGGIQGAFVENDQEVEEDFTITAGRNAHSVGPITIATGVTVTVPSGSRWLIS